MAGNSVPIWDNKAITFRTPPGLSIVLALDGSPSMGDVQKWILDENNIRTLETALRSYDVGTRGTNYYNYQGFGKRASEDPDGVPIEDKEDYQRLKHYPSVDGVEVLSVPGQDYLDYKVQNHDRVTGSENAGVTINLLAQDVNRFIPENDPLFIALGNEQAQGSGGSVWNTHATAFKDGLPVKYRYVGVMPSTYSVISTDPSEDPVPTGTFRGYVWVNDTRGVGVYFDGNTINYRFNVLNDNIEIDTPRNVWQPYMERGKVTYGAAFNLRTTDLPLIFEAIGIAFGQFVYDPTLDNN